MRDPNRPFRLRRAAVPFFVATLLVAMSACSSAGGGKDKPASTGTAGSAASSVRGVTADTINVAGLASLTMGGAPYKRYQGIDAGAKARYWQANEDGGVHGRKIKYIGTLDDGGAAANLSANLSKAVVQDSAFLVAPYASNAPFNQNFIDSNQVPTFGLVSGQAQCTDEWMYGWGGCVGNAEFHATASPGALTAAVTGEAPDPVTGAQKVKPGTYYGVQLTAPYAAFAKDITFGAKHIGWDVCYSDASIPPAGTTDFSSAAAKTMSSCNNGKGPDGLFVFLATANQQASYVQALRALGWKGQLQVADYDPSALKSPEIAAAYKGAITYVNNIALPDNTPAPIFKQIEKALKGSGASDTTITAGVLIGWITADMAVQGLKEAGKDLTLAGFQTALAKWTYPGIKDLTPEVPFPLGRKYPIPCFNVLKVEGDHYKEIFPLACGQVLDAKTGEVVAKGFKVP